MSDQPTREDLEKQINELQERVRTLQEENECNSSFLNDIINYVPDLIFVKDTEHRWVMVNDALCRALGRSREELIGRTDYDIHTREQSDIFWEKDNQVFETEGSNINEEEYTDSNGNTRCIQTSKTAFRDSRNHRFLVGISRDITIRKLAEQEIKVQKLFTDSLINSLPGVMYVINSSGRFVRWNRNFEEVTGCSSEEISNMGPLDFFDLQDRAEVGEAIENAFSEGTTLGEAGFLTSARGSVRYLFTGYRFEQNGVFYLIGVGIDISDRVESEKEKENLIVQLKESLSNVRQLSGLLPICSSCKKIRDDRGYWNRIETYISSHSEADFSHSLCPECARNLYSDYLNTEDNPNSRTPE